MKKRYTALFVLLVVSLLFGRTSFAQDGGNAMALNDATPGVDIVITPAPGTTGAIALELAQASVRVVDTSGAVIFQMADPRVHKLELRLAPNAGPYTLTAERLPGVAEAYIQIGSQADLSEAGETLLVSDGLEPLGVQQSVDMPLTAAAPSHITGFTIPAGQAGTMKVSFPGAPVAAQVVDETGLVVAMLSGSGFDGLSLVLDSGTYQLTLLNTDPARETLANMEILPALPTSLDGLIPSMATQPAVACAITVDAASVNLRSGPGTGYSVLDYGFRNDQFQVGGMSFDGSWVVVATLDGGSAWMSRNTGALSENCSALTVYDIPYREAPEPQVVVVQQPPTFVVSTTASSAGVSIASSSGDDDHEDEHEDEHEDDDD